MTSESSDRWCCSRVSTISVQHFCPHTRKECYLFCLSFRDLVRVTPRAVGNSRHPYILSPLPFRRRCVPVLLTLLKTDWRRVFAGRGSSAGVGSSVCLLSLFCHTFRSGHLQVTLASDATVVHVRPRSRRSCLQVLGFISAWSRCLCSKQLAQFRVLFAHQVTT